VTYRKRADKNHAQISDALRKIGCKVLDLSRVGGGCPDVLVWRNQRCCLLEYKTETGKLNKLQLKFHSEWSGCTFTVRTPEQAIEVVLRFTNG
jgi:hypothetical protein